MRSFALQTLVVFVVAVRCACLASVSCAEEAPTAKIESIDQLWAGYDPRSLPLEVETIKSWDEGDIHLETIYFTGEVFAGEKTRVFGYLGRPRDVQGRIPGVLHIHGGGQTAYLDWPRFWARRGYACLSFDFCGDTNLPSLGPQYRREHFTRWGKVEANMMAPGGGNRKMTPTPYTNPWYHWTMAARRGLTLLEAQEQVDAERLGIFGISMGGTLTWMVAGVDPRVKAAVPIYGNGWESYDTYPPQTSTAVNEDTRLWRLLIAPEAHAPRIQIPVLFMSATNDFHGKMDLGYRSLDLLASSARRQVFTPNFDHHIEPAEARSLPLWMDAHLRGKPDAWPAVPQIEFTAADTAGVPQAKVTPPDAEQVERVDVYYALSNDWPMTRFWRTVETARRDDGSFVGAAPFVDVGDLLIAFANVTYRSGIRHSSAIVKCPANEIPGARPTLARQSSIDLMETATDWTWVPAYTDPNQGDTRFFEPWQGKDGERGFTLDGKMFPHVRPMNFYFGTRKIGDPQFRGTTEATLAIDCLAEALPEKLTIRLRHRMPGEHSQEYTADVLPVVGAAQTANDSASGAVWSTLRFKREQFKNPQDVVLPDWAHVEYFILNGTNPADHPPVFKRLRWE